jgi:hypothetical protein
MERMMTRIMARMPGRCAVMPVAAAVTLVVSVLGVAGPAAAQRAAPAQTVMGITANTTDWLCASGNTTQDCWAPVGPDLVDDGYDTGHSVNEVSVLSDSGSCNHGRVASTCPFVTGSGLNHDLVGHTIVVLNFIADGTTNICADSSGPDIWQGNCSGSHAAYVIVDGGKALVSVGASNAFESRTGPNDPYLVYSSPGGGGRRFALGTLDQRTLEADHQFIDTWVEAN